MPHSLSPLKWFTLKEHFLLIGSCSCLTARATHSLHTILWFEFLWSNSEKGNRSSNSGSTSDCYHKLKLLPIERPATYSTAAYAASTTTTVYITTTKILSQRSVTDFVERLGLSSSDYLHINSWQEKEALLWEVPHQTRNEQEVFISKSCSLDVGSSRMSQNGIRIM